MTSSSKTRSCAVGVRLLLIASANSVCASQDLPTPAEFVALQKSLAAQFSSVSATTLNEGFNIVNGRVADKPSVRLTQTSKWKPGYSIVTDRYELQGGAANSASQTWANTPVQSRSLFENDRSKSNLNLSYWSLLEAQMRSRLEGKAVASPANIYGTIQREPFQHPQPQDPFQTALGVIYMANLDSPSIETTKTRLEGDSQIVFEATNKHGWVFTAIVDRRHGYMPTSTENKDKDGKVFRATTLKDYREVGQGLWLPFSYSRQSRIINNPRSDGDFWKMTVLDLQVNATIPDKDFKPAFPIGTRVEDKISGSAYIANETEEGTVSIPVEAPLSRLASAEEPPAQSVSESDLTSASNDPLTPVPSRTGDTITVESEPSGSAHWVLWGGFAVAILGVARLAGTFRRRHR